MALKFFLYGAVFFSTNNRRNQAKSRVESRATADGFVAEPFIASDGVNLLELGYGAPWPGGTLNVTQGSFPGFRFCYSHTNYETVEAARLDVSANWNVEQDSDSFWGFSALTVPG